MTSPLLRRSFLKTLAALVFGSVLAVALPAADTPRSAVKLLTVGNSFAYNVTEQLPGLARASGKSVNIFHANLSGASLERHVEHLKAFEANPDDPQGRLFLNRHDPKTGGKKNFSLREALESDAWDVVTIQQASGLSFQPDSYEPHATELIDYIRKYAPQAEIMVIETWAYRYDHPTLKGSGMTPAMMHEKLGAAYHQLAEHHKLRVIPVGDAFFAARQTPLWTLKAPDPAFDYQHPPAGQIPDEPGNLHRGWGWEKDGTGKPVLKLDAFHANIAGCFLGGSVLYEILFDADVSNIDYTPSGLSADQAASLRRIAHETAVGEHAR